MKRDFFTAQMFPGELIIDNFAGGGGTSTGLEQAFGRPVDIAINHNAEALAMHAANHPHTLHLCESVWDVDPVKVTNNQPVGLVWLSPDCKHFSKAKGGKPVEKNIRGLAWVSIRWLVRCKPRAFMLENVEEFKAWGPLLIDADGKAYPDPTRKGETFRAFVSMITTGIPMADREGNSGIAEARDALCTGPLALTEDEFAQVLDGLKYAADWRELKACDFGAPTIRKRFFMVGRRDGQAISWPDPTHGNPKTKAVQTGKLLPWHTAAECIDWEVTCPSIFERDRPLAEATLRRIAKGIMRYVVESDAPYIVRIGHTGHGDAGKVHGIGDPLSTITSKAEHLLVSPSIVSVTHQGGDRTEDPNKPFNTITGAHRGEKALAVATMVQSGYGERQGQEPRALDIEKPLGTVVGGAVKHAAVTALLVDAAHGEVSPSGVKRWGQGTRDVVLPLQTVTASGGNAALVSAFLAQHNKERTGVKAGRAADLPISTLTASGSQQQIIAATLVGAGGPEFSGKPKSVDDPFGTLTTENHRAVVAAQLVGVGGRAGQSRPRGAGEPMATATSKADTALLTAHMTKFRTGSVGSPMDEPMHTMTAGGDPQRPSTGNVMGMVSSSLVKLRGTSQDGQAIDEPLHTISAQGTHFAEVRAFLLSYYGSETETDSLKDPVRTVTSRDRFGLVTLQGQDYQIVDIGLRMLTPRELFRAQGFPGTYVIDTVPDWTKLFVDGHQVGIEQARKDQRPLTKSAQVRMCGNSVCPPLAAALARANFKHEQQIYGAAA